MQEKDYILVSFQHHFGETHLLIWQLPDFIQIIGLLCSNIKHWTYNTQCILSDSVTSMKTLSIAVLNFGIIIYVKVLFVQVLAMQCQYNFLWTINRKKKPFEFIFLIYSIRFIKLWKSEHVFISTVLCEEKINFLAFFGFFLDFVVKFNVAL